MQTCRMKQPIATTEYNKLDMNKLVAHAKNLATMSQPQCSCSSHQLQFHIKIWAFRVQFQLPVDIGSSELENAKMAK